MPPHLCQGANILFLPIPPAPSAPRRTSCPAPCFLCRAPPCTRRPPLKKGSIRKLFCGRATYFLWKGKESGMPEPLIFGNWSMDTGRRPLCGCFVLPPARPEKAKPFQAGQSPCTKHPQIVRLCLYAPKKVFEGSKGRFFKNAPWQGVGRSPTKTDAAFSVKRGEKGA